MVVLTDSQRRTYEFICKFIRENAFAPKLPEIAEGIGIQSRGVVHRYIRALERAGLIEVIPKRHRGIRLLKDNLFAAKHAGRIPLVGRIAAGHPIDALESDEVLDLAAMFSGENCYALKVKGSSMINEGIFDGDWVVCERRETAQNGEIVVALVDDGQATLKRFYRQEDSTIILKPANDDMEQQVYSQDRVKVQGILVGQLRNYRDNTTTQI